MWRIVLSFFVLIMVNYLGVYYNKSFDLTKEALYSLSAKSLNVLADLEKEVEIVVFLQKSNPLFKKVETLLEQYQEKSSLVMVNYVDPVKDIGQAKILASKYGIDLRDEMILVHHKFQTKLLQQRDIAVYDHSAAYMGMPPQLKSFSGESALTGAILGLQKTEKNKVHFLTGHGEKSLKGYSAESISYLNTALTKENIVVEEINLLAKDSWPEDVKCLVIAGPTQNLTDNELKLLKKFVDKGGKLCCFIDSGVDSNLIPFLKDYGILVNDDIILDPSTRQPGLSVYNLFNLEYLPHPVTDKMLNIFTFFVLARSVKSEGKKDFAISPLTKTSNNAWGEVDYNNVPHAKDQGKDLEGPLSVAVVAHNEKTSSRLFVVGDSDFISNQYIGLGGGNFYFFQNALHWLLEEKELISIPSKEIVSMKLPLTENDIQLAFIFIVIVVPLIWLLCALFIFFVRRK